jgi:AraC-like DNA-binding protein
MLEKAVAGDLYEPAAKAAGSARLHMGEHTLFLGPLGAVSSHAHATPALVLGLYEPVKLQLNPGATSAPWLSTQAVVVPAGALHRLHTGAAPVAVLYASPARASLQTLAALVGNRQDNSNFAVCGNSAEQAFFRELYEAPVLTPTDANEALSGLLERPGLVRHSKALDPRVRQTIEQLHRTPEQADPLLAWAAIHNLSPSRLMHLFSEQLHTPFRRYRTWCRLQTAMRDAGTGVSLTQAALSAGFSDSQHFSREFRRAFGVTASEVLRRLRKP